MSIKWKNITMEMRQMTPCYLSQKRQLVVIGGDDVVENAMDTARRLGPNSCRWMLLMIGIKRYLGDSALHKLPPTLSRSSTSVSAVGPGAKKHQRQHLQQVNF